VFLSAMDSLFYTQKRSNHKPDHFEAFDQSGLNRISIAAKSDATRPN
jgi:hypothetical protein